MITKNDKYPVEGNFIINANTRLISVPTDFNKNGVGVVGDNAAETLEFVIDRYFDEYDLAVVERTNGELCKIDKNGNIVVRK